MVSQPSFAHSVTHKTSVAPVLAAVFLLFLQTPLLFTWFAQVAEGAISSIFAALRV
jgi:hypothetical protein